MKSFAIVTVAILCISAVQGQTNIDKLRNKNDQNEKDFNDDLKTKETEMLAFRSGNRDKVFDAIDTLKANIKAAKDAECSKNVDKDLKDVESKVDMFIKEITAYYNPRKVVVGKKAEDSFKAAKQTADDLQKKYKACGADEKCQADVNKEVDAKLAEAETGKCTAASDLIERARNYSKNCTAYLAMRVEYLEIDLKCCGA